MSMWKMNLLLAAGLLKAQTPTLVAEAKFPWTVVRDNLLKMAEKMPAENYSFRPVPDIETFGQRVAHIAGANLRICQGVSGQQKPFTAPSVTSKPELVATLKAASACDYAFDSLNDTTAMDRIDSHLGGPFPPTPMRTKLATLNNLVRHSNEVYGYMCVYLRLKGIVPPAARPNETDCEASPARHERPRGIPLHLRLSLRATAARSIYECAH